MWCLDSHQPWQCSWGIWGLAIGNVLHFTHVPGFAWCYHLLQILPDTFIEVQIRQLWWPLENTPGPILKPSLSGLPGRLGIVPAGRSNDTKASTSSQMVWHFPRGFMGYLIPKQEAGSSHGWQGVLSGHAPIFLLQTYHWTIGPKSWAKALKNLPTLPGKSYLN